MIITALILTSFGAMAQLTVTNGATIYAGTGATIAVPGYMTNSGTITGPGTVLLNGSSNQPIDGTGNINNLTLNNSFGATISSVPGTMQNIYGTLIVVNGNLATAGNLTIKSTASGTASVGNSSGTISGFATVERYIQSPGQRAWHLLGTNTYNSGQTIKQAWQENGGPIVAGVGTLVTSNLYNGSNGFDVPSVSASVLTHSQGGLAGSSWNYNLPNTNGTVWSAYTAYMLFVRGDRNYTAGNSPSTGPTMLRSKGDLHQGTQPAVVVSATGTGRTLVGNPFASAIDLETIFSSPSTLDQNFYIWDPTLTGSYGVGGFRVVQRNGANSYTATPGLGANDNTLRYIPSGGAFFLKATGTAANVVFNENSKTNGITVVNPITSVQGDQQIIVNLVIVNSGNIESLADGARLRFDASYAADTTDDIGKLNNFAENICSYRDGKKLIVEQRPMIVPSDTIFLRTSNTGIKNYRLKINTENFVQTNLSAWLQDTWLNTNTILDLSGNLNDIDFNVTSDPASANPDRFRIIFALTNPLPVSFTSIKAFQQGDDIEVEWKVSNQVNILNYEVERSTDGINFTKLGTKAATGANGVDAVYNWLDLNPVEGNNFYRVRSIGIGGEIKYSAIVKVTIQKNKASIEVYPNPVTDHLLNIRFTAMVKGVYRIRLVNTIGQTVFTQQLKYTGDPAPQAIVLGGLPAGNYQLEIIDPANTRFTRALIITK